MLIVLANTGTAVLILLAIIGAGVGWVIGTLIGYLFYRRYVARKHFAKSMMLTRSPGGLWHAHGPRIQPGKRPRH